MQPTFPAVFISTNQGKQFLLSCGEAPTVQLLQYFTRPLRNALLVDSNGDTYRVTTTAISGVNWRWLFMAGPVVGLFAFVLSLLTLSTPVLVRASYAHAPPMSLTEFKSVVLSRIAASTSNFMGGGDSTQWRSRVNTAHTFAQLVSRLSLRA